MFWLRLNLMSWIEIEIPCACHFRRPGWHLVLFRVTQTDFHPRNGWPTGHPVAYRRPRASTGRDDGAQSGQCIHQFVKTKKRKSGQISHRFWIFDSWLSSLSFRASRLVQISFVHFDPLGREICFQYIDIANRISKPLSFAKDRSVYRGPAEFFSPGPVVKVENKFVLWVQGTKIRSCLCEASSAWHGTCVKVENEEIS